MLVSCGRTLHGSKWNYFTFRVILITSDLDFCGDIEGLVLEYRVGVGEGLRGYFEVHFRGLQVI